jgi:magnesium transporter
MVTPTYYVYFTSTTIITSAVLFRGFKGTPTSIVTVVNGFLTICAGVVLLQLSKSAKDVPDAAVFSGDLDQIHTIAEQEQPESEPKADAIRGAAAIVRRISVTRQKMEVEELKRLHEEKQREQLEPVSEDGAQQYEWDGIRRRRTMTFSSTRSRPVTSPSPMPERTPHPPLGMSRFPTEEELAAMDKPILSSIAGTIRNRARSIVTPNRPDFSQDPKVQQSPMHPVPLTEIVVPTQKADDEAGAYYGGSREHVYNPVGGLHQNTAYHGAGGGMYDQRATSSGSGVSGNTSLKAPTPPPHSARRQFSFQNVFKRHQQQDATDERLERAQRHREEIQSSRHGLGSRGYSNPQMKGSTEEERLGLVKGDSQSMPALPQFDDGDDDDDDEPYVDEDKRKPMPSGSPPQSRYGRGITSSPPRKAGSDKEEELAEYESQRQRWNESRAGSQDTPPPEHERRHSPPRGGNGGAFI